MPTCPNCQTEQTKRVEGRCPKCWTEVSIFKTKHGDNIWFRTGEKSPPAELMEHWCKAVSKRLTEEKGFTVNFSINIKQKTKYMREVAQAENLLAQIDYDLPLAKATIDKVVADAFKVPSTLAWAVDQFILTASIVDAEQKAALEKSQTVQVVESMEDIWD